MSTIFRRARCALPDLGTWGLVGVMTISLLPLLRMLGWVRSGTHLQYNDYWEVLDHNVSADGWLRADRFLNFDHAHLLAVPKLVYWLNGRLFDGSNIALGHAVILVVVGQILLLWHLLPTADMLSRTRIAIVAVAIPMLLFAPHGAWNFLKAMSGTAWLISNLVTIAAIVAAWRGHKVVAGLLAVVAALTYGTGLSAWVAVLVVSVLRDRRVVPNLPSAGAAAATYAAYALAYQPSDSLQASRPGPVAVAENAAALVGSILVEDLSIAPWLGAAALAALAACVVTCIVQQTPGSPPWIGLAAAAVASTLLIGFERHEFGTTASRYSSVAALIWVSLAVLGSLTVRPKAIPPTAVAGLSVWLSVAGSVHVGAVEETYAQQARLANALRVGVAEGAPRFMLEPFPALGSRLHAMGHYPFSDVYDADCGLLGSNLEDHDTVPPPASDVSGGATEPYPHPTFPRAVQLSGWIDHPDVPPACIVVADETGRVVGVGVHDEAGWPSDAPDLPAEAPAEGAGTHFTALAPRNTSAHQVWVAFSPSEPLHPIGPG